MYSPEFVSVLTHLNVDTPSGRDSGHLHSNLLLKAGIAWGPVSCVRAIWAGPCWILKTSSDEGCVTSLGSLSQSFHFHPGWSPCVLICTCSHCPLWQACLFLMGSLLATLQPSEPAPLGLSRACWSWLSAEMFPMSRHSCSEHFFSKLCALGVQKTVDDVQQVLRKGENPFPWLLVGLTCLLPARLPAALWPGWTAGCALLAACQDPCASSARLTPALAENSGSCYKKQNINWE